MIQAELETFLARAQARERSVPRFVERELRGFLRCGGRMRLLAAIQPPEATQAILDCLDLQSRAPPTAAALPDADDTGEWLGDLDPVLLRFVIGVPALVVPFVVWAVVIGWAQGIVGGTIGRSVVDPSDEWHWLALVGLLILPLVTTVFVVRYTERRSGRGD